MSPAGSTSEEAAEAKLIVRPTVTKTFVKGAIGLAAFSVFLQLSVANLVHYIEFLAICFGMLGVFLLLRRTNTYELGPDSMTVRRFMRGTNKVVYQDILDVSVSQGMLAKRFNCGTVFFLLKSGKGSVRVLGGGVAEQLEDVPDPQHVYDFVTSRLSPFSSFVEP